MPAAPDDDSIASIAERTSAFVRETVIPVEHQVAGDVHDAGEDLRRELQAAARKAKVFAPHVSTSLGGQGLDMQGQAVVFQAGGYSLLGPLALNCAAPDEGNMHLLDHVATPEQRARYLEPLAAGDIRSCFAMTEPPPGAGSDPRALSTTATRVEGGWRLDGRKWFITGAQGAAFAICVARTSGAPGDASGATMFLVDVGTSGFEIVRNIPTMDRSMVGGHSELALNGCFVGEDAILGELHEGFAYAQVRLAPARLTHCMRWLGIARRAQDIALDYVERRQAFGSALSQLGMVQELIASSEIDLEASQALIAQCARQLDQSAVGPDALHASSVAKVFVSEAVGRIVDRAVQMCGAVGVSEEVLLSRFLREVRAFRIYDGPSETHRWSIARRASRRRRQHPEGVHR